MFFLQEMPCCPCRKRYVTLLLCVQNIQQTKRIAYPYLSPFSPLALQDEKLTKALIHTRFVKSEVAWKVPKKVPQEVVVKKLLESWKIIGNFGSLKIRVVFFLKDYESCKFTFQKKHYRTTEGVVFAKSIKLGFWALVKEGPGTVLAS